jgi:hypothetical protein
MSLTTATDEQILQVIEESGSSGTDNQLTFTGNVGNTFVVQIFAGLDGSSDPQEMLEHLIDYKLIGIELYYMRPSPSKDELTMEPVEFEGPDGKKYRFEFDVHCWPHIAIDPANDQQFKSQSWAIGFHRGAAFGYRKKVDPHTLCDILRYCDRMARLKMFW